MLGLRLLIALLPVGWFSNIQVLLNHAKHTKMQADWLMSWPSVHDKDQALRLARSCKECSHSTFKFFKHLEKFHFLMLFTD